MLVTLTKLCDKYVNKNIKQNLVLKFLNTIPRNVIPDKTFDLLVSLLRQKTNVIIKSEYFLDVSLDVLRFIFSENILNIKEDELFFAALRWSVKQLENSKIPITGQKKRKILDSCEYLIRFGSMPLKIFLKCCSFEPDFFSSDEFKDIIYDIYNETDRSPFLKYKRICPDDDDDDDVNDDEE